MKIETSVNFEGVRAAFASDNERTPERNNWLLGALEIANRQFGRWKPVVLTPDELGRIMLPQHEHGVNIIPPSGTTVAEAAKKIGCMDRSIGCYQRNGG